MHRYIDTCMRTYVRMHVSRRKAYVTRPWIHVHRKKERQCTCPTADEMKWTKRQKRKKQTVSGSFIRALFVLWFTLLVGGSAIDWSSWPGYTGVTAAWATPSSGMRCIRASRTLQGCSDLSVSNLAFVVFVVRVIDGLTCSGFYRLLGGMSSLTAQAAERAFLFSRAAFSHSCMLRDRAQEVKMDTNLELMALSLPCFYRDSWDT